MRTGPGDWGRENRRDHPNILAHYDIDMHREAELDHLLPYAIVVGIVLGLLGLWKALDLVIALVRWAIS